ncbi:MAG TPA: RDD family protein [Thermoanaerobaculia bacterium]
MTAPPPPGESPLTRDSTAAADGLPDFPLRPEPPLDLGAPAPESSPPASVSSGLLPDRALGTAADAATSILVVLVALLAAFAARGRTPRISGLGWAALFGLTVSFFAVVVPLVLFGRTVGMALAGLVARDDGDGRPLTPSQAARRWLGTLATIAGMGLPLFWTARDPDASTPADRLSGRTLVRDG